LALSAFNSNVLAATPVDLYQSMESGSNGNLLTPAIMNASSYSIPSGTWSWTLLGSMWVSTSYSHDLPGPVSVNGTVYNGTGSTKTWMCYCNNAGDFARGNRSSTFTNWTFGCYLTTTSNYPSNDNYYDMINIQANSGIGFVVAQLGKDQATGHYPSIRSHSKTTSGGNYVSTTGPWFPFNAGQTYWVNMKYDASAGQAIVRFYDPSNSFSLVGESSSPNIPGESYGWRLDLGRTDNHGNDPNDVGQAWYSQILLDTSASPAWPLIPSAGTDTTPPSAPGTVRDGTGSDIAYTTSTTQLSANWDVSSDAQSGISGYQYAIGTSAGGTQTVNWTSLGNVTTVTKTGLSLTSGQTYFFSVKAVNGVGLTGNATNSNGQKVDSSAPSAPANVRDGTGTDISTTSSNTQLSANWDASADAESGISGYQYAIGTTAGGTQTVNWTSLGNVTTVTKAGLTLTVGQAYYFSVKAVNGAGLTGSATNSNGQTVVDITAPSAPPAVRDGTGADISTTNSTTQLSANWDASTDAESGISGYQYAIGTTAGGTQTVTWTSLGNVTTVTKAGLTLTVGQTYYFSVKAVNGAGLTGNATNSNGQTVVTVSSVVYFQDNFESWTAHGGAWSSVNGESSTHSLNTSTTYAKAGAKSLKLTDTDTTGSTVASLTKNFSPAISGDIYVRFYLFLPTGYASTNTGYYARRILRVWCGSNRGQMSIKNEAPFMEEIGAWSSTYGSTLSENAWHCIEMHVAPPSASTLLELWVDGVANSTNLTANFSASSTFDHIDFGDVGMDAADACTATFYLDELVVSNTYVGTGITSPVTYFSDTFDTWTVHGGAWSSVNGESSSHTLNTSTDQARSGTKSLKLTDTDSTGTNGAYLTKNFSPTISGGIYVRFYVFLPTGYGSANVNDGRRVLHIYCGSNRGQMSIRNAALIMEEIGAWGTVTGPTITENAWHCIEMHITAPTATTVLEFWVDGVLNSGALMANFSASSTFDHINFGDVARDRAGTFTATFYLDEAVVSNSYIGPLP
jgi:hypothetical protein